MRDAQASSGAAIAGDGPAKGREGADTAERLTQTRSKFLRPSAVNLPNASRSP